MILFAKWVVVLMLVVSFINMVLGALELAIWFLGVAFFLAYEIDK